MQRRTLIASVGAIMGTGIGATAYTSATVSRAATISVAADSGARIQLTPSAEFESETTTTNGELAFNIQKLNANSNFVFGDAESPNTTHAFTIVNQESASRNFALDYGFDGTDPDSGTTHVQFDVFSVDTATTPNTVTTEATVTEDSTSTSPATFTASSGTEYYVVLTLDTTGVDTSNSNILNGDLTINASTSA